MGGSCLNEVNEEGRDSRHWGQPQRLVTGFCVLFSHFFSATAATSEDEVNMWIKGLNWLVADTLRAATPLQIERWELNPVLCLCNFPSPSPVVLPAPKALCWAVQQHVVRSVLSAGVG